MKRVPALLITLLFTLTVARTAEARFAVYDVLLDPQGESLAGYQVKIKAPAGVKFVGVEGGEHPAFKEPPVYDLKALNGDLIILAAVNTTKTLPSYKIRVAALHVRIEGNRTPEFRAKVQSASTGDLKRISPVISIEKRPEE